MWKIPVADFDFVQLDFDFEQLISIVLLFHSQFCFIQTHWITSSIQLWFRGGVFCFAMFLFVCFVFFVCFWVCGADVCCFRWTRCINGLKLNLWICCNWILYFYSSGVAIITNCSTGSGNGNWHHGIGRVMSMMVFFT